MGILNRVNRLIVMFNRLIVMLVLSLIILITKRKTFRKERKWRLKIIIRIKTFKSNNKIKVMFNYTKKRIKMFKFLRKKIIYRFIRKMGKIW